MDAFCDGKRDEQRHCFLSTYRRRQSSWWSLLSKSYRWLSITAITYSKHLKLQNVLVVDVVVPIVEWYKSLRMQSQLESNNSSTFAN